MSKHCPTENEHLTSPWPFRFLQGIYITRINYLNCHCFVAPSSLYVCCWTIEPNHKHTYLGEFVSIVVGPLLCFCYCLKMKWLFLLWLTALLHHTQGATVNKCITCLECDNHRRSKVVCELDTQTRCLKFVGIDINREFCCCWPAAFDWQRPSYCS